MVPVLNPFKCKVPPSIFIPLIAPPSWFAADTLRILCWMVMPPVKLLLPLSVSVPVPVFINEPPVPVMFPMISVFPVPSMVRAFPFVSTPLATLRPVTEVATLFSHV
jgi:hypothetical protein